MGELRGVPALAVVATVALLVLAAVTADEPSTPLDVAVSAEGQTPEPVSAKLEASGESDLTTSAQRPGRGLTSGALSGSPGVPGSDSGPDGLDSGADSADSADSPDGGAREGAILDVPSRSNESDEGPERDADSEEAAAAQGI